jgi:AraC family transcriptional regulator
MLTDSRLAEPPALFPSRRTPRPEPQLHGVLAAWQERIVTAYIDADLGEPISLATLVQLGRLSLLYVCRAIQQSRGVPPHRHHTNRRVEHIKGFLYGETNSFAAAFHKSIGLTLRAYRRSLAWRDFAR